jgi:SAM-dependent methyltransferase
MHEYDLIAEWYASDRNSDIGVPEVTALASSLPRGASVIDIGCGNGNPITRALLASGCDVVGIDSSLEMLARFRLNCPDTPAICTSILSYDFEGKTFDGAVAWGVMFHLTHADQESAIRKVSQVLNPGARFLFTSGDQQGSIQGAPMNGVPFRYFSFSVDGYRDLLRAHGFTLIDTHADRGQNTYYLAARSF